MISVCTTTINSRLDLKTFIDCLYRDNQESDFELVITHDNRTVDGTGRLLQEYQAEYKNLKVVPVGHPEIIAYLEKLLVFYEERQIFTSTIRAGLLQNLESYKQRKFFNPLDSFLWISSGPLYNRALREASGEALVISPSDFIYLFKLKDVEQHIRNNQVEGMFYSRFNGIRISRENILNVNPQDYPALIESTTGDAFAQGHHGSHATTRKTLERIGYFTEAYYGRAVADNHMNARGHRLMDAMGRPGMTALPKQFSMAWCKQTITTAENDLCHGLHPVPGIDEPTYLHKDVYSNDDVADLAGKYFSLADPPFFFME